MKSRITGSDLFLVANSYKNLLADAEVILKCDPNFLIPQNLNSLQVYSSWFTRQSRLTWNTFEGRLKNEGFSFVSKYLPALGKAIEVGLESGFFCFENSKCLPPFLREVLIQIFELDGRLRLTPNVSAIRYIRQFCYLFYKYEAEVVDDGTFPERDAYLANEAYIQPVVPNETLVLAKKLITLLFEDLSLDGLKPHHSSGAVAGKENTDARWEDFILYEDLDVLFDYKNFFFVNDKHYEDFLAEKPQIRRALYGVARQYYVPKDSRGRRGIAMEPKEHIYLQGCLMSRIYDYVESHKLTRGRVNFTNQGVNGNLAMESSVTKDKFCMDLKDASDLVSLDLVKYLFAETELLEYLLSVRTKSVDFYGEIIHLKKFAAMGSRVCFPILALTVWAVSVASAVTLNGSRMTSALANTFVYGDDLIGDSESYLAIISGLESAGLKVNKSKSFCFGNFRESCGVDAYNGHDVTPVRFRTYFAPRLSLPTVYESYVQYANALEWLPCLSSFLWKLLETHYGPIPYCSLTSDVTGRKVKYYHSDMNARFKLRFRSKLSPQEEKQGRPCYQRLEILTWVSVPVKEEVKIDGWPRLLRNLIDGAGEGGNTRASKYGNILVKRWVYLDR